MNFVWESWLGFDSRWLAKEIAYNPVRGIDWDTAVQRLRRVIMNLYRALKPGRYASICYHDTSERNWSVIQDAIRDAGFELVNVLVLDPKQKTQDQITKEKVVKSDLVLNCRKPRTGEHRSDGQTTEAELVTKRVRDIVLETLAYTGGQARDKLWDIVLKRLLVRGAMAEHRFDEILTEVAFKSESGRWFLKEEYESLSQSDIQKEEEAGTALERFARMRMMGVAPQIAAQIALGKPSLAGPDTNEDEIEGYIKNSVLNTAEAKRKFRLSGHLKGIEFYDCLFFYLTRFLKSRKTGQVPRRNLAAFLEEYLVRFREGDKWLYRPPDKAEAQALHKSRQSGLGRRIRQYVSYLTGEGDYPKDKIPDAKTLVAWLKHCSAFGLADEGVVLYERGGLMAQSHGLSQEERYDAEEYYLNCRRKASKAASDQDEEQLELENDEEEAEE